ncbi:trypco2 family protein [Yinghuangia soli]|uniref:Trypsin-co-occurring domain-containing protein n=1 Tax=Yinghuangia soli TaxID=2908204 RepID=A0AA41QBY6_9ACTN|nr:trypco2 family protein [Yinghuangia soli]MCF2533982.1 hypothetical protein [Yinghuangia soli]
MSNESWADLGDAISAIRQELQRAMDEGAGKPLRFRTGPVELEFTVEVTRDAAVGAKVRVLPWSVEAKGGIAAAQTNRIKVTLQPVDATGKDAEVSALSPQRPE